MFARVTHFELDTVRTPIATALAQFEQRVVPALRRQPGYEGVSVFANREGKGVLVSLWSSEQAAVDAVTGGFYDAQMAQFVMLLRSPAGRDHYEVLFSEVPTAATA